METEEGPADDLHRLTLLIGHCLLVVGAVQNCNATVDHARRHQDVEDVHPQPETLELNREADVLGRQFRVFFLFCLYSFHKCRLRIGLFDSSVCCLKVVVCHILFV